MHNRCLTVLFPLLVVTSYGQHLKRINGTSLSADSLEAWIKYLMKAANVSGVAITVFNNNKPVFSNTYGFADVQQQKPFQLSSVMYGASFAKTVFTYIAMQLVQENIIDLDKPLVDYLKKVMMMAGVIIWYAFLIKNRHYHYDE
jgi:D-alanyl-D-alanine-carboxypeptidase/D-alanyl-D-alanine-endopeptidase